MVARRLAVAALAAVALALVSSAVLAADQTRTSKPFQGAKVNGGTVTMAASGGQRVLTLSGDFKSPDTPDPHWQVIDSRGNAFLLQRLMIKGDKLNRSITLPAYVGEVARVQIYCAWAEAVLGETSFDGPAM
jgi:hypothetical protein